MHDKVVSSKFTPPIPNRDYVVRERLSDVMIKSADYAVTLVYGAAGSGKTSLIRNERLFREGFDVWLNIDESFDEFETFWRYTLSALSFDVQHVMMSEKNFERTLSNVINDINKKSSMTIVFDDFHHIKNELIIKSFNLFLDLLEQHISIVLTSRQLVNLNNASRLMNQTMCIIDENQLLFTKQESLEFLSNRNVKNAKKVSEKADGWIGALHLLSLNQSSLIENEVNEEYLRQFIINEIYNNYNADDQSVITNLAYLPFFDEDIIEFIHPIKKSNLLGRFIESKMMIQQLSTDNETYRFHHLLGEAFIKHSQYDKKVLEKVASYYKEKGYISESLQLYELIEDTMNVMMILLEYPNIPQYYYSIKRLSIDESMHVFEIAYQKFFYHYSILDFKTCKVMHEKALLRVDQDIRFESFRGMEALVDPSIVRDVFSPLAIKHESDFTTILVNVRNSLALAYEDKYHEANKILFESLELSKSVTNFFDVGYIYNGIAQMYEELGYINDALLTYDKYDEVIKESDNYDFIRIINTVSKTGLYLKAMKLDKADEMMNLSYELSEGKIDNINQSLMYNRIEWHYLMKEDKLAFKKLLKFIPKYNEEALLMYAGLLKYAASRSQLTREIKQSFRNAYEMNSSHKNIDINIIYAQCVDDQKHAIEIVDHALVFSKKHHINLKIIELALLKMRLSEDERVKVNLYKECLYYGQDHKILSPFIVERNVLKQLYQESSKLMIQHLEKEQLQFHHEILRLLDLGDYEPLSEREREVLMCIADDMSNNEIANHLFISLSTVKTHINNVYNKLNVNTRVKAIGRAKEIGIL